MKSIRTKFTLLTVCAIIISLSIATLISVISIKNLGHGDADKMLHLMCRTGALNLEAYFDSVEHSVKAVSKLVQESVDGVSDDQLHRHVERARNLFEKVASHTNGVLTYYYRIDPALSKTVKGFWYVNLDGNGFQEHEVTDITQYDTNDTSKLVWFTVPKATKKGLWLPPYFTENLGVRVISYNVPVYRNDQFIGVIGIEIDYQTLSREVENIRLYEHGYAFILDAKGNFVYHPQMNSAYLTGKKLPDPPKELLSDSKHIHYTYMGEERAAAWTALSNGMRLYVSVPVAEINSSWLELIRDIIFASVMVLLIVSFLTMRFAGHITKPLLDLTEAAKEVDKGNYNFTLDYNENDEIGTLANTFRQLVKHVKDHINDLNKKVYVDALTSVRNKGAFTAYIQNLQNRLDSSEEPVAFAVGVFDCDNLKKINDKYGHDKGDIYLKTASRLICRVFQHSPVFRIGGDEFAVVLLNDDYQNRDELFSRFLETSKELRTNAENDWEQVNVTLGLAVYDPQTDGNVDDVARRADLLMYENKRIRKANHNITA